MNQQLVETSKSKEGKMIGVRCYLHQHPELSFHEDGAAKYIAEFYKGRDVGVETGAGPRGIKIAIDPEKPGRALTIRADFDALPITEDAGLSFVSQSEGVMHACDHNAYTAYMLVSAETFTEMGDNSAGKTVVTHQLAEEAPPGGTKTMAKNGVLDGVNHILGVHAMSTMKTGRVYYKPDCVQTRRTFFKLKVQSKGGHSSLPRMTGDVIVAGSCFAVTLQTVVSRRLSPFEAGVVTIGSSSGKGQFNVIKGVVEIGGDVRGLADAIRATVEKGIKCLSRGLRDMYDVTYTLEHNDDYPVLYNGPEFTEYMTRTLKEASLGFGVEIYEPQPSLEDFVYHTRKRPSTFIHTGVAVEDGEIYPHHHPKSNISEKSLLTSAGAVGAAALDYPKGDN